MTQAQINRSSDRARGELPHVPAFRFGQSYRSLDAPEVCDHRDGAPVARVSQVNAGLIRRDLRRAETAAAALRAMPTLRLIEVCARASDLFADATLPLDEEGPGQTPAQYLEALGATCGLPHVLGRANVRKIQGALQQMGSILRGLTRGIDPALLDQGSGVHDGVALCFAPQADALGVVLPSNSPGVNSIWLPSIALRTPVVIKPGRLDPWTPLRIIRALIEAGCPRETLGLYPADHDGAAAILECCGRGLIFGDDATTAPYASNPAIEVHGAGRSKILIGRDQVERWPELLDVLAASILDNGGRSCINASSICVPAHAAEIADALARRLAAVEPRSMDDPDARLAAFPDPAVAQRIDQVIERGLQQGGEDVAARHRSGPRLTQVAGSTFLRPTLIACARGHPLANTEFLFPFAAVVEVEEQTMLAHIGPSLVVTVITHDDDLIGACMRSTDIQRLNIGAVPTLRVEWDQPHEGNLFDLLWTRKAIQRAPGMVTRPPLSAKPAPGTFDFQSGSRLVFGPNTVDRLGELARSLGGSRCLLVSDPGVTAAGHVARAQAALEQADVRVAVFDRVHENPTTADVDACVAAARPHDIDIIIGLGGGSPMDTAKGCNFLLTNGGRMEEYRGRGHAARPMLPMIAVPTTAGTGSEVQSFALIADARTHGKMACGDPQALPRVALLDPTLALSQPRTVSACSGLDAIGHAIESAVTTVRTPLSGLHAREAFRLAVSAFPRVLDAPRDLEAQGSMLLAASLAGIAIENSMLGAAHSMANPLTAHFDVAHGHAVAVMLPHVVRFNSSGAAAAATYAELTRLLCAGGADGGAEELARWVESMLDRAGLPRRLTECGVAASAIPELSQEAARQWTAQFNPRPVSAADFEAMYREAM